MKYYAIADLHGRYDLLLKAVDAIEKHSANDSDTRIITLGDYIDRGPDSNKIIEYLMSKGSNWTCLKGNHEDIMLQTYREPLHRSWWYSNGGMATDLSYGGEVYASHLDWVESLPLYYETPGHVFVHAGIPDPDAPLEEQNQERFMWMLYNQNSSGGWQEKHVVHGHHIHEDGPHEWEFRTALDTGSFFTGRQVIGVFDDSQGKALEFIEIHEDNTHPNP